MSSGETSTTVGGGRGKPEPGRQPCPKQFVRQDANVLRVVLKFYDVVLFIRAAQQMRLRATAHPPDMFNGQRHRRVC
jgi:hypothetical protein